LVIAAALVGIVASSPDVTANADPGAPAAYELLECGSNDAPATVSIDAGTVTNSTILDLSAHGGTAVSDSSGGHENAAVAAGDSRNNDGNGDRKRRDRDEDVSETAAAGNGGIAGADANGGAIAVENVNSGGNVGSAIAVGDTLGVGSDACGNEVGGVIIDGGEVINETIISVSVDGGTAIADASGGDGNVATTGGRAGNGRTITSSAGNGGVSTASADGGVVSIGDINSGGNAGNAIAVGETVTNSRPICCDPVPPMPIPGPVPEKSAPVPTGNTPGKVVVVQLPSTGGGAADTFGAVGIGLLAVLSGAGVLGARFTRARSSQR
jgi:hypothetical protein